MHLEEHFQKLVTSFPSDSNGICFCVGSLGANEKNDVSGMLKRLKNSVTNSHWRTVKRTDNKGSFYEDLHHLGSVKLSEIVKDFLELKIDCHFRADHAEWMWQNLETKVTPGYAGIGRFGATRYLEGLLERFTL